MTNRRIAVEAALGFGPFDTITAGDWVPLLRPDGRERVKAASWSNGRDNELEPHPAGTASITLWNQDRQLDPDNGASVYAGQLLPLVPVRIRSQDIDTSVWTDEFYGYVDGGWEQELAPKGTGDCQLDLLDLLGVIGGYRLPGVFEAAVLALNPTGYWPLTDGAGGQVKDLGSGSNPGVLEEGPSTGADELHPGLGSSIEFDGEYERVDISRSPLPIDTYQLSVVAVFATSATPAALTSAPVFFQGDGNNPSLDATMLFVHTDGTMQFEYIQDGVGFTVTSAGAVNDGRPHLVFAQSNVGSTEFGVGIDSATLNQETVVGGVMSGNGASLAGTPFAPRRFSDNYFQGRLGHVAIYDAVLDLANRQSLLDAFDCLTGLRSDEHIAWGLDQVGVPAGLRNLDQGAVLMGAARPEGREAIDWLRDVVATEQGELYIDHRNGGVIRFRSRYARHLDTRSTVPQATFSDDPAAVGVIRYPADGLDIASNGREGILNQVTVTWDGGEVVTDDATSIAMYGPRARQVETVAATSPQARSTGEWLLARYRDPRSRIRGVTASRKTAYSRDGLVHGLRIGDRVTFRVRPLHTGTATEVALWVDGIDNEARGVEWTTTFRFAPADTFVPWIWGVSEWGVDNLWG